MPSISVRKIDKETLHNLRIQAAQNGRSMEEEVRQILKRSVSTRERLGDLAVRLFSDIDEEGSIEIPKREINDPISFSE